MTLSGFSQSSYAEEKTTDTGADWLIKSMNVTETNGIDMNWLWIKQI